jgi:predicted RNA binding protein YcfA (HicA-like mRNA interferase family)
VKRRDLDTLLKKAGWKIISGGTHDLAIHPDKPGIKLTIPRHRELNEYTARGILKDANVKREVSS